MTNDESSREIDKIHEEFHDIIVHLRRLTKIRRYEFVFVGNFTNYGRVKTEYLKSTKYHLPARFTTQNQIAINRFNLKRMENQYYN